MRKLTDSSISQRNSAVSPKREGSAKSRFKVSTIGTSDAAMKGTRRPRRDCQPSDSDPTSGSITASTTSPAPSASPARPPGSPHTAVT